LENSSSKRIILLQQNKYSVFEDYDIPEKPIGEGAFGVVYKAVEKKTGLVRAAKKISTETLINETTFKQEV